MDPYILPKDRVGDLVEYLLTDHQVLAPVERNGELRFDAVTPSDEVSLDYRNTNKSPKGAFFPQTETLIRFGRELDGFNTIEAVPVGADTASILLGVRPCDVRSFLLLDAIFGEGVFLDPYYRARRENTLVVSLGCPKPRQTCFCHAFGSGPYDTEGTDVFMQDAGDAFLVEAQSERGAALVDGIAAALELEGADDQHVAAAAKARQAAEAKLPDVEPVAGIEALLGDMFDSEVWAEISEKCLACGTCTYVCPTCHCFAIEDMVRADGGERVRAWDSCMFEIFTKHASGHNPRPNQAARWRQRTMHKFEYLPRNVGQYGCVGCGRCIIACPVRLDIRDVLDRVRGAAQLVPDPEVNA